MTQRTWCPDEKYAIREAISHTMFNDRLSWLMETLNTDRVYSYIMSDYFRKSYLGEYMSPHEASRLGFNADFDAYQKCVAKYIYQNLLIKNEYVVKIEIHDFRILTREFKNSIVHYDKLLDIFEEGSQLFENDLIYRHKLKNGPCSVELQKLGEHVPTIKRTYCILSCLSGIKCHLKSILAELRFEYRDMESMRNLIHALS